MGYVFRRYDFHAAPPALAQLVGAAELKGALPISFAGAGQMADIAFECHRPGVVSLVRQVDSISIQGESADTSVLIDLLDACIREAGGTSPWDDATARILPLPLTQRFIAQEVRHMHRIALGVVLFLAAGAVAALAGGSAILWFMVFGNAT
jgi:hypothetical protein